ncbi:zinc-dependent alcohol dehydrogenase family protein [Kushneria indalinina]|uniref:NADPH:quinone reductase-like Zn-dependent oxidoreductase n=1 Tax=Kushneria indalinina DSM 14324 TaxID=1122140 RepID=A0A3D9DYE3_9GAMM|nr:zinc-dependent alcohol dehydrogenase family protein [Kushneria indalinina]REC95284.1 NADPH:quinone reductase-like Zn-dependent oxidoreductase [Kushneria indalinina DSM 14324]
MNAAIAHADLPLDMQSPALRYHRFGSPLEVLHLEPKPDGALPQEQLRVRMTCAPINPSDLIPIAGVYRHRIAPPLVAGHEGVGVVIQAHGAWRALEGRRVLPLRGPGTWQQTLDCDPRLVVPVPDDIPDHVAARAWINPMTAMAMLGRWPVEGCDVLLTAAGSNCARLLAQWALCCGARSVTGICRSTHHRDALTSMGVQVLDQDDHAAIDAAAARAGRIFDATGGRLADRLLTHMPSEGIFVTYGALSGVPISSRRMSGRVRHFHLRDHIKGLDRDEWQSSFETLWALLRDIDMPPVRHFRLAEWRQALIWHDSRPDIKSMLTLS